ncbi:MAG: hypothetical protein R6V67_09405 [Spirochaetia bacterium]
MTDNILHRTYKTILAITALLLLSTSAAFAEDTGSITLTGSVPEILKISIAEEKTDFDLTEVVSGSKVAEVREISNRRTGYRVELESANGSAFAHNEDGNITLDYSLTYGGDEVTFSEGTATISDVSDKTDASGSSKDLSISYSGEDHLTAGDYKDTLTFTIIGQ